MTLRELVIMAESRQRHDWSQTSAVLWMLAEQNRDRKKKPSPYKPSDFDPTYRKPRHDELPKADIRMLKELFVKEKK